MTNYEKIKAMSVEEMAALLNDATAACSLSEKCDMCPFEKVQEDFSLCTKITLHRWLLQEAEE